MSRKDLSKIKEILNWPVFLISGGILVLFVLLSVFNVEWTSTYVDLGFDYAIRYFGPYWQILLIATFIVGAYIAFSRSGNVVLGKLEKPEMSFFKYLAIIVTTGLGAGGVFWAAAEPMYYFIETPPVFSGIESGTEAAVSPALAQSFLSWGFTAWSVYGAISVIVIMYAHNHKGMPLKPRTLLYPIFGSKIKNSAWGTAADVVCIIGAAAGTIGPIGFLGLQVSYGVNVLFGWPNTFMTQVLIIVALTSVVLISTLTGIDKGIQWLSRLNVNVALIIAVFLLIFGPGLFLVDSFISSTGVYLNDFIRMSTFRGDNEWLGAWTLFFFGWFIGFGPLVALLVARVSRGRTIREIFLVVAIMTPVITSLWFTVLGGSGIHYELNQPGSISGPLLDNGLPAAIIAIAAQMPLGTIMPFVFLLLTILFVVTTVDSMSYSLSMSVTGVGNPPKLVRVFWAVIMAVIAVLLINIGGGGIGALQSFVVVAAVPVSILMLPLLWYAPKVAKILAREQGFLK
ncbi:BCCT family transporter [Alkalicoccobacillus murimartini]|uniref:Choline-glycine betaine transporter n=1 Tax=Alkalicoccobacillus murimartini TaxID=171685 RepID=A0ABT9YHR2_9BACI|nr:BCCT family transporter [Alkalicoccobacillus murimartini]MDQ0207030.1 choline-glycine betaine transporter [Alkalicoccobacillus murimartini]